MFICMIKIKIYKWWKLVKFTKNCNNNSVMPPPQVNQKSDCENNLAKDLSTVSITASFSELNASAEPFSVATLVFFDLETTGLANFVGKKNVQITEISMIAVSRDEFFKCHYPDLQDVRVVHKLSLCVRPKCSVSSEAAKLTGLCDDNLRDQEPFDKNTAFTIISFLSHLPKPICLLAHNGQVFDFPILKAEFEKLNIHLPSEYYIIDTLIGCRDVGIPDLPLSQKLHKNVKFKSNGSLSLSLSNLHLYFFGKQPLGSHSSEGDCITLAKVCHKLKEKLLPWIDKKCCTFESIKPIW